MPGGNGTGPAGMGPMTGRAAGYCAGYATPGFANPMAGRGFWGGGRGRGGGFGGRGRFGMGYPGYGGGMQAIGYGNQNRQTVGKAQELEMLREQTEYFEGALEDIKKRIAELETRAV